MSSLLNFTSKLDAKVSSSLKTFADLLDHAFRYIIQKPHISQREVVGFVADRLARFIASCPVKYHERLIHIAVSTLPERVQKYKKKG